MPLWMQGPPKMWNSNTGKVKSALSMFSSLFSALWPQMCLSFEDTWWDSCRPFSVVLDAVEEERRTVYSVLRIKLAWYPLLLYITPRHITAYSFEWLSAVVLCGCTGPCSLQPLHCKWKEVRMQPQRNRFSSNMEQGRFHVHFLLGHLGRVFLLTQCWNLVTVQ